MKVLVQWTRANPTDWEEYDSTQWTTIPKKPVPVGGEIIDDDPGWIHAICIQGVVFISSDHYVVWHDQPTVGDVSVVIWNNDPVDWDGLFHAQWWIFQNPAPDPVFGGRINTRQWQQIYGEQSYTAGLPPGIIKTHPDRITTVENWNKFRQRFDPDFDGPLVKHGIWVDDALNDQHKAVRTIHGWREWII